MFNFLIKLFGKYVAEAFSFVPQSIDYSFIAFLLMWKHKKKNYFPLRFILSFIAGCILSYAIAILNTKGGNNTQINSIFIRILCYTLSAILCLAQILICDNENAIEILTCWCKTIAIHQLVGKLYPLCQNILGIDDKTTLSLFQTGNSELDYIIYSVFKISLFIVFTTIFRKKRNYYDDSKTSKTILGVSVSFVIIVNCFIVVSRLFEQESMALNIIVKLFTILFSLTILIIFNIINSMNKSIEEEALLQQLWKQDQAQFKSIKSNIDFINGKCHDLKHILNKVENKLNSQDVDELKNALDFYDCNVNTGNDVLDVVLIEKKVVAGEYNIAFTIMTDGSNLDIFTSAQLYSLFGNIIDNAIEATKHLEPVEKRVISLTVFNRDDHIFIQSTNYFNPEKVGGEGNSSKEDKDLHGYGLKSIRKIAESHGGTFSVTTNEDIFDLKITIPVTKTETKNDPV